MTTDWPTVSLSELVENGEISYGIVQPGAGAVGGVPIVRVKEVRNGIVDVSDPLRVDPEVARRHSRTTLRGGELLVTIVGTVGEAAVVPTSMAGWNVARAIAVLRPTIVSPAWIRLCLRTSSVRNAFDAALNTTVQATLNLADLKRLRIPVPPRQQREAITEVLGALDDKIAANDRVVHLADELAQVLTRRSFDGATTALADIAVVTMGSSPPGKSYNERGEGVPFYQGVRDFGFRFPRRRVWTTAPVREARASDTLVSVRAPVGRTNLAAEDMCIGRGVAALRSRAGRPMSVYHQIRAAAGAWAPYDAEGTVFGSINKKQLEMVHVPSIAEQRADTLEEALAAIEGRISAAIAEDTGLATTRDELLPLLMSGKLRVKDAEKVVEEVT